MTRLIRMDGFDKWAVISDYTGAYMLGTLDDAVDVLESLGVLATEIDYALTTLRDKGHNVAHFGVLGKYFIFSELSKITNLQNKEAA